MTDQVKYDPKILSDVYDNASQDPKWRSFSPEDQMDIAHQYYMQTVNTVPPWRQVLNKMVQEAPNTLENFIQNTMEIPQKAYESFSQPNFMQNAVRAFTPQSQQEWSDVPNIAAHATGLPALYNMMNKNPISGFVGFGARGQGINLEEPHLPDFPQPSTPWGQEMNKFVGNAGLATGGAIGLKNLVEGGLGAIERFPYNKTMDIRKAIPPWVELQGNQYDQALENLIQKSGGKVPTEKVSSLFKNYVDDPAFETLNPGLQKRINNYYEDYATRPDENVDAMELINNKRILNRSVPVGRFDVNKHFVSGIGEDVGRILEPHVEGLGELNSGYKKFFDLKKFANQNFQPWETPYNTASGENLLGRYLGQPTGVKKGLSALEDAIGGKSGKFVGGAKYRDIAKNIVEAPVRFIRVKSGR